MPLTARSHRSRSADSRIQKIDTNSPSRIIGGENINGRNVRRYTSLKDLIPDLSFQQSSSLELKDFNSLNICIKNELVKRAASAYLQSAIVLGSHNPNSFVRVWGGVRERLMSVGSCLELIRNSIGACISPMQRFLVCMVVSIRRRMNSIS